MFYKKDEIFNVKDIITIQDPINLEQRTVVNFDYIKNNLAITAEDKQKNSSLLINQNQTSKRIFEELEKTKSSGELNENPIKKLKLDQGFNAVITQKIENDSNSTNVKVPVFYIIIVYLVFCSRMHERF